MHLFHHIQSSILATLIHIFLGYVTSTNVHAQNVNDISFEPFKQNIIENQGMGEHKIFNFKNQEEHQIICAPMRVCLIKLAPYEKIIDQFIGDSIQWQIISYDHIKDSFVAIKPEKAFLKTNYIIVGSLRTYYFNLQSDPHKYMNSISFAENNILSEKITEQESILNLKNKEESHYKIIGEADFKPIDVKVKDQKTYIYLPKNINELPIFIAKTTKGEIKAVNARWIDNYYMIDEIIKRGELIKGVGKYQEKIEIILKEDVNDPTYATNNNKNFQKQERN